MDAAKFIQERNRMCKSIEGCGKCPAFDSKIHTLCAVGRDSAMDAADQIALVEEWSAAHPRKTRQSIFMEQYPNAACIDGILVFCPKWIDNCFSCLIDGNNNVDCATCRHEFWMQGVE